METITVKLKHAKNGWTWERKGTDGINEKSWRTYSTPSEALYGAYGWELRGNEDKPITKDQV